jgi:hypothetical protein
MGGDVGGDVHAPDCGASCGTHLGLSLPVSRGTARRTVSRWAASCSVRRRVTLSSSRRALRDGGGGPPTPDARADALAFSPLGPLGLDTPIGQRPRQALLSRRFADATLEGQYQRYFFAVWGAWLRRTAVLLALAWLILFTFAILPINDFWKSHAAFPTIHLRRMSITLPTLWCVWPLSPLSPLDPLDPLDPLTIHLRRMSITLPTLVPRGRCVALAAAMYVPKLYSDRSYFFFVALSTLGT